MDLKEEAALGGDPARHWYYRSKGRAIKALISPQAGLNVLDVGAGSGVFSKMLVADGLANRSTCVDPNYSDDIINQNQTEKISYQRSVDEVDADLVLMLDVIEHVDDDVALIESYADRAAPGTQFLISAPAFQCLWSSHDDFLDHRRRYTLAEVEASITSAGLRPKYRRYFFGLLFPLAALQRLADRMMTSSAREAKSQLAPAPAWLNAFLIILHDIERNIIFPINKLAGVTAFCLAEKPLEHEQADKT